MHSPIPSEAEIISHDPGIPQAADALFEASPQHLQAAAFLYGINSAPLKQARVLELGCASAGHLTPFACAYPESQIVGIDSNPAVIEQGRQIAQALQLDNLQLLALDLAEVDAALGLFDYIIVRDLYSHSDALARAAILHICKQNLAPHGIAYVGYNTYPGWKTNDMVRDLMLMRTHGAANEASQLSEAKNILQQLHAGVSANNPLKPALRHVIEQTKQWPDYKVAKEYLHNQNTACYLLDFAGAAMQAGLGYIGDAVPQQEVAITYDSDINLASYSLLTLGQPKVMQQQYLDFASGRSRRLSLLTHQEREAEILPQPRLELLTQLRYAGHFKQDPSVAQDLPGQRTYINHQNQSLRSINPLVWEIVETLTLAWPCSMSSSQLLEQIKDPEFASLDKQAELQPLLEQAIGELYAQNVLRYMLDAGPYDQIEANCLQVLPCSLINAATPAHALLANLWHDAVSLELTEAEHFLLPRIDGLQSIAQPINELTRALEQGLISPPAPAATSSTDQAKAPPAALAAQALLSLVEKLQRQALLMGSSHAWSAYLKEVMLLDTIEPLQRLGYLPALLRHEIACTATPTVQTPAPLTTSWPQTKLQKLLDQKQWRQAEQLTLDHARAHSTNAADWVALGQIYYDNQQYTLAQSMVLQGLARQPLTAQPYNLLGRINCLQNRFQLAENLHLLALMLDPSLPASYTGLGYASHNTGRLKRAEICYRQALALDPSDVDADSALSLLLGDHSLSTDSARHYMDAIAKRPNSLTQRSYILHRLILCAGLDPEIVFREHRKYGELIEAWVARESSLPHRNSRKPERALRIGFVSGDLYNHAVTSFVEPIWSTLDTSQFQIYVYSNNTFEDDATLRLKAYAKKWQQITELSDRALAELINTDQIDILFDLSGHTDRHRLNMFARKPAPIQISLIGYPGTTGLQAIDYYFVDQHAANNGKYAAQFTEKLVYLPNVAAFIPPADSPPISPLPMLANGYITFGSFNRLTKITEQTLILWCQVLHAIPNAMMLLGGVSDSAATQQIQQRFAAHGITPERLLFRPRAGLEQYQRYHQEVDLLLDTLPYAGGTTTNHGLWMGVPTLTLPGDTPVSTQAACVLGGSNLTEWICETPEEFVAKAQAWAQKPAALAALRLGMRQHLLATARWQPGCATASIQTALRIMWRNWCAGRKPESFSVSA